MMIAGSNALPKNSRSSRLAIRLTCGGLTRGFVKNSIIASLRNVSITATVVLLATLVTQTATAQFINVETPLNRTSDSYFERIGIDFGFSLRGGQGPGTRIVGLLPNGQVNPTGDIVFRQGSLGAVPQFGGFDPNTAARSGIGIFGSGGSVSLGFIAGKGNTRSNVTTAPSITIPNGGSGTIFSGELRPFVTGIVPVLGQGQRMSFPNVIDDRDWRSRDSGPISDGQMPAVNYSNIDSTAEIGALSLQEITARKNARVAAQDAKAQKGVVSLVDAANKLIIDHKYGAARAKLSRAVRLIDENSNLLPLRESIAHQLEQIKDKR